MRNTVGRSIPKVDILPKVLGKSKYADDFHFSDVLHATLVRSKVPHAKILNINTSRARKMPSVKAVITAQDFSVNTFGISVKNQNVLASKKIRYFAEPLAAIAADSEENAENAADEIEVTYQELPAVFDPSEALRPDAPLIHSRTNLANQRQIRAGNIDKGFKISAQIVEDTFSTQKVQHCHLEPRTAIARVDSNGRITVWSSLPITFAARDELARVLNLPSTMVRIIQPECGGSFGARNEISLEPYVALLALRTRRPVKMRWSREEEFVGSTTRHSYQINYKTGAKKDGQIIARKVKIISDAGAYSSFGEGALTKACILATGPYKIPHVHIDGYLVFTNNPVGGAMRGFGAPQVFAAEETHMDHIAEVLKIDPLELRQKNALKAGDTTATGQKLHSVGLLETMKKAARKTGWFKRKRASITLRNPVKKGLGVACMIYPVGLTEKANASSAFVKMNPDGTVNVSVGASEVGQGSKTVLSQIAAEELGVSIDKVNLTTGNTDNDPYDLGACASRVTYATGNAVQLAAAKIKRLLFETASETFSINSMALVSRDGHIFVRGSPEKQISIETVVQATYRKGKPVCAAASFNPANTQLDPKTGQGSPYPTYVFATQIAEVEVDTQTGIVKVLRITAAHDVGKAINPELVKGQVIGGIGFGIGQALLEEMVLHEGRTLNPSFLDYLIPTSMDIPDVEVLIIEEHEPSGPFGAKGVAEPANVPTAPAILNAIKDAIGVRINSLPATPPKILTALAEKNAKYPTSE